MTGNKPTPRPGSAPAHQSPAKRPKVIVGGPSIASAATPRASRQARQVDICFVFDTTGSMFDKIDGLVNCMAEFVGELARLRLDWRATAVPFGDLTFSYLGDRVVEDMAFVSTREAAQRLLRTLPRFHGGGNLGESSLEATMAACRKSYRQSAVKILVVLTDEPPLEDRHTTAQVAKAITKGEFICFVASPDPAIQGPRVEGFKRWAQDNGGEWYPIGPSMKTAALLQLLKSLVRDIPKVADKVHELGQGSVRRYLQLKSGTDHS